MTRHQARPVIESILNQLSDPQERIELLKEMIPGAVENYENFELRKARIAQKFAEKGKFQIIKKSTKKAKQ